MRKEPYCIGLFCRKSPIFNRLLYGAPILKSPISHIWGYFIGLSLAGALWKHSHKCAQIYHIAERALYSSALLQKEPYLIYKSPILYISYIYASVSSSMEYVCTYKKPCIIGLFCRKSPILYIRALSYIYLIYMHLSRALWKQSHKLHLYT